MTEQQKFVIQAEQRDAILAYFMTRPMQEVENGVIMLRTLPVLEENSKKETKE